MATHSQRPMTMQHETNKTITISIRCMSLFLILRPGDTSIPKHLSTFNSLLLVCSKVKVISLIRSQRSLNTPLSCGQEEKPPTIKYKTLANVCITKPKYRQKEI